MTEQLENIRIEIETLAINATNLADYANIPISFEVRSKLDIKLLDNGLDGMVFDEEKVIPPYIKDYDGLRGEGPTTWAARFDVTNWDLFMARIGEIPVGGATIAFRTPGVDMLDGREDLTVLWDIRVRPEHRRSGIGTKLFAEAAKWSKERGCTQLKVETQNTNVPACRFYTRQGCRLGEVHRYKYIYHPEVSHEIMLVWYLDLGK
jgi:ribosomal protein S18 acetylase RimI-like enzyme